MLLRRLPHALYGLVAVLLVAGLMVTVWKLGGFEQRTDQWTKVTPGTVVSPGPFELSFSYATAEREVDSDGTITWVVTVEGIGRTTGDESLAPQATLDPMFAARDLGSSEVQEPYLSRFGPAGYVVGGRYFTPGLPPVQYAVIFHFSDAFVPGKPLRFVVVDQEYRDPTLIGHDELVWRNADSSWVMDLPVRLIAADS